MNVVARKKLTPDAPKLGLDAVAVCAYEAFSASDAAAFSQTADDLDLPVER